MDKQLEQMRVAHRFGAEVAEAMNHCGVKPPEGYVVAVLTVIAIDEQHPPIGGAINFNEGSKAWEPSIEVGHATPHQGDPKDAH